MDAKHVFASLPDWKLWRVEYLRRILGTHIVPHLGSRPPPGSVFVGWGRKRSGRRAQQRARRYQSKCWLLEDGFLRSIDNGAAESPLSIVVDDVGIYYDATRPSRLERLVQRELDAPQRARARSIIEAWRAGRVSKYNSAPDPALASLPGRYVLVVDQVHGDASIRYGSADPSSFQAMLAAALAENPDSQVILKVHPDVVHRRKSGHFDIDTIRQNDRILLLHEDAHPATLLEFAECVYVVTSQLGFEALLWGRPVRTFGMPFYAGWGLTRDELPPPDRRHPASLEALVHAALIDYPKYMDPETSLPCEAETVLAWVALQRRMRQRLPAHIIAAGFSRWKKTFLRDFLWGSRLEFRKNPGSVALTPGAIALWGRKHDALVRQRPASCPVLRIEDGFLRSVGLGADLIRPLSWVVDDLGIYYDATRPSRLEQLLATTDFSAALRDRAQILLTRLIETGVTKYNTGRPTWQRPSQPVRVILVPGQVESDASIKYGAMAVSTNMALVRAVREANPDAWVVYKPHPDVLAGLRQQGAGETDIGNWCDEIVGDISINTMMDNVDELHVLTSLAGFEALIRDIPVTTYGQPFYAGWGLTRDLALSPEVADRRARRLTLQELVAGTLLLYPTYVSRHSRRYTTAERALTELLDWRRDPPGKQASLVRRAIARVFRKA
ncbi:capsular polysaccharide biosynthesis protein [Bordetella sp. BOR01]|uniref:capsular polysaccharide biosynthesis protein n=1 Tax=Bordetella sp. BOR01 TaxID=2854779 RepID=UPI001C4401A1|nr:capsular polysaccharide biosynthesis protein [Bordetella sp. BOR01]MBV7486197.1 capsular polysaccharide biosynthesis protein [Bordetella sp. BOR01]